MNALALLALGIMFLNLLDISLDVTRLVLIPKVSYKYSEIVTNSCLKEAVFLLNTGISPSGYTLSTLYLVPFLDTIS